MTPEELGVSDLPQEVFDKPDESNDTPVLATRGEANGSALRMVLRNYLYTGLSALVAFLAKLSGDKLGIEVGLADQLVIVGALTTGLIYLFQFLYKRYGKGFVI